MTPWTHHLASRWTRAFRTPTSCVVGFGAAFMVTGLPDMTLGDRGLASVADRAFLVAMNLAMASWFVAASGVGGSSSGRFAGSPTGFRREAREWPNPALPLDPGIRALVEGLAGFGAMLMWLVALGAVAPLSSSLGLDLRGWFVGYLSGAAATRGVIVACCLIVPGAMAWLLPARSQAVYLLRGLTVMVLATVAFVASFNSLPQVLLVAAALVAALVGTSRLALGASPFTRQRPLRSSGQRVAPMVRAPRSPLAQLWRDACFGPLRATRWVLVAAAACLGLGSALARARLGPEIVVQLLGAVPPLGVATALIWCPLGTTSFAAGRGVAAGAFNDSNGLAWLRMPLRREWVLRAFYVHGTVIGLAFVVLNLLAERMTGAPAFFVVGFSGDPSHWGDVLCAVPPFAGFLTCRAAGDRVRGVIALACVLLIWTGLPFTATGLAAALAVLGGAPPLAHLFGDRSRRAAGGA